MSYVSKLYLWIGSTCFFGTSKNWIKLDGFKFHTNIDQVFRRARARQKPEQGTGTSPIWRKIVCFFLIPSYSHVKRPQGYILGLGQTLFHIPLG